MVTQRRETPDIRCQKVAFIGTHGVGKTTLTYELAARLKRANHRVELVKEVARRCPLPLNQDTTLDAQAWILHTQIALEIESTRGHDVVICDRSVLDNYAYLVAQCGRIEPYDQIVRYWTASYSLLAWVPPIERPSFDGVRDLDPSYQLRIHDTIRQLLTDFGLTTLALDPLARDGWIDEVVRALPPAPEQLPLFSGADA